MHLSEQKCKMETLELVESLEGFLFLLDGEALGGWTDLVHCHLLHFPELQILIKIYHKAYKKASYLRKVRNLLPISLVDIPPNQDHCDVHSIKYQEPNSIT